MRAIFAAMLFAAGIGLAGAPTARAAPIVPGVIGDAAGQATSLESVHCRRYRHRSRFHRYGFGCGSRYYYGGPRVYFGPRVYRGYRGGWRGGRTGWRGGYRSGRSGFRGGPVMRGGGRSGMRSGMRGGGRSSMGRGMRGGMRSGGGMQGGGRSGMRGGGRVQGGR